MKFDLRFGLKVVMGWDRRVCLAWLDCLLDLVRYLLRILLGLLNRRRRLGLIYLLAIVLVTPGIVEGDVLYDTTWMTENQEYDAIAQSFIGGIATFNTLIDTQAADDFELVSAYELTSVTGDFLTENPDDSPADGILVELFEDVGGVPSEVPFAAVLSTSFNLTPFKDTFFGLNGHRVTVDLSGEDIFLTPGIWWLSIVPVDVTPTGVSYRQVRTLDFLIGHETHARDGGIDHGNGYQGLTGVDDWTPYVQINGSPGDLAMNVEGTRRADLDGDGVVGVKDLLILLGNWGSCSPNEECPGDLDGDGVVGVKDLLILLGQWG